MTTQSDANLQAYNADLAKWMKQVEGALKARLRSLAQKGKGDLVRSVVGRTGKRYGEIDLIGYKFLRHGVFLQKGVGRGHIMQNGVVVRGYKNPGKRTDLRSVSGQINRHPKDWFNDLLRQRMEGLTDVVANHYADRIVNATTMEIK